MSIKMPFWLRAVSLVGVVLLLSGVGFLAYRYYERPATLTVAVGSIDGEGAKAMSAIASRLASTKASVRLKIIDAGTVREAAEQFAAGKVDLAVVRSDVGDLSDAQTVILLSHVVVLLIAPPGSSIDDMDKLRGRKVGVVGGNANSRIVDVLTKQYDLARGKVVFRDIALPDVRRAVDAKEVSALLIVTPLTQKYLSAVRGFFPQGPKMSPVLIPIDSAEAIAEADHAYENFDVPKGTLRGFPPVPDDDVTTLRTSLHLVAHKKSGTDLITELTEKLISVRRDLLGEQAIFAEIGAPSTDADAYLPVHPGAAAFYNGTQQSFIDKYSNYIYLGPMLLGGIATVLAAGWKFLGIGQPETVEGPLDSLYALARRIRSVATEAELSGIEDEIDDILKAERSKTESDDENAVDAATLNVIAHRLENMIHDRRVVLATKPAIRAAG
jgi:TRAP-type uncharacterized transport system substrate-binding protein